MARLEAGALLAAELDGCNPEQTRFSYTIVTCGPLVRRDAPRERCIGGRIGSYESLSVVHPYTSKPSRAYEAVGRSAVSLARNCRLMARKVSLFFDCISPYTHISLSLWSRYVKVWPVDLTLRPFFLGGVMAATGNQPPGMLPVKGAFLAQDLPRSAALYEVDLLETPSNFFDAPLQRSALKG